MSRSNESALFDLPVGDSDDQRPKSRSAQHHPPNRSNIRRVDAPYQHESFSRRSSRQVGSLSVVEEAEGVESQDGVDGQSTTSKMMTSTPHATMENSGVIQKVEEEGEALNKARLAKLMFWICFVSELISIGIFVGLLSSKAIFVQQSAAAAVDNTGRAQVMVGINDTYRVKEVPQDVEDEEEEAMVVVEEETKDDILAGTTLCPDEVNGTMSVQVDNECYELGIDPIVVSFQNCSPHPDDWLGIYNASHNIFEPGMYAVDYWYWACGDQVCQTATWGGEVTFAGVEQLGSFRVYLQRHEGTPEEMYLATSQEFYIAESCT
eukprot:scaffold3670_cov124-Cylindrotheca_fusiformis.AAC.19